MTKFVIICQMRPYLMHNKKKKESTSFIRTERISLENKRKIQGQSIFFTFRRQERASKAIRCM